MTLTRYRKAVAAAVGAVAEALALGLLSPPLDGWATVLIGFATTLGVYATPNTP